MNETEFGSSQVGVLPKMCRLAAQFNTDGYFVIFHKNGDERTVQQSMESGSVVLLLLNRTFSLAHFKINLRLGF